MSQHALDYQDFVEYGEEIREPIHGIGVYAAQRRQPKGNGFGRTEVRRKFAVVDVDNGEIVCQTKFIVERDGSKLDKHRHYTFGYRTALLDERDRMETDR